MDASHRQLLAVTHGRGLHSGNGTVTHGRRLHSGKGTVTHGTVTHGSGMGTELLQSFQIGFLDMLTVAGKLAALHLNCYRAFR